MQCLYVIGTTTERPLRRGVHLWEVSVKSTARVQTSLSHDKFFLGCCLQQKLHREYIPHLSRENVHCVV